MNIYQERWIPQPTPETQHFWAARGPVCTVPFASYMKRYGLTSPHAYRIAAGKAFESAGIGHDEVDHLMNYDAFAHLPIMGLEDLGFVGKGEAADFIFEDSGTIILGNEQA
jgi:acetyl-CoA acetyltransferase